MKDEYLADLFSQNVGKKAYIEYHRSGPGDCWSAEYSSVEGGLESCSAEAQVVVLSSKSGVVHFRYTTACVESVGIALTDKAPKETERQMSKQKFPPGWDEARVQRLIAHYDQMEDDELTAEDEAALEAEGQTLMMVPTELVPTVRELIAKAEA
jgi:hypothetical protein